MDALQLLPNDQNIRHARVAPLAKLPVFWAIEEKRVVVAGGSDAAAWKAELLAACGAEVHVYAEELSETFSALIDNDNRFFHHREQWSPSSFEGAAIAIADCEDNKTAAVFFDTACRAGVPVNIIDNPNYCQFQFGSIVNRSPVVVAISTDGAAPILAQAIRRRIETLLPPSLTSWAALAHSIRDKVNARIMPGASRRAFWEHFVDRAFGVAPGSDAETELFAAAGQIITQAKPSTGRVTLVGAGPGDAELLTLKAVRALQAADVILFDDLVSDEVLELARREAKRMLVGKRGGLTSCEHEDINAMMIRLAKAGKRVVRLKSGDPMMFVRTREEITYLQQEGILVDIVSGITSASGVLDGISAAAESIGVDTPVLTGAGHAFSRAKQRAEEPLGNFSLRAGQAV